MTPEGAIAVVATQFAPVPGVIGGVLDLFARQVDAGLFTATVADLLRLLALPFFGWAAWRDVKTRRIPGETWRPMVVLGVALFAADAWAAYGGPGDAWPTFVLQAGFGLGFVVPLVYLFWRIGGFGGADVKAVMVLTLLFPAFPEYLLKPPLSGTLPWVETPVNVFAFTILTNAVLVGGAYPLAVTVRNALAGRFSRVMFVGHPVPVDSILARYGRLLERPDGTTRRGLDLDALRMYLRWRGLSLSALREDPERYRDPATLPAEPNDPTDGNVDPGSDPPPGATGIDSGTDDPDDAGEAETHEDDRRRDAEGSEPPGDGEDGGSDDDPEATIDDPWGAEAFLEDVEGTAYGTRTDELREGLEVLADQDTVWVSPGLPFVVPLFLGLASALVVGDLFFALLYAVGAI